MMNSVPTVSGLLEIADRYDALLCDVWGVLHNGREAFRDASDALAAYRRRGGTAVLITNAPRPAASIREQVTQLGVAEDAFDAIVTSGDVTLSLIAERIEQRVHHIGPERDLTLFETVHRQTGLAPKLSSLIDADYVICTGLVDDVMETVENYETTLHAVAMQKLPFICANPDLVVHRGDHLVPCAGALAARLIEIGGDVIYCGKPHGPIYDAALRMVSRVAGRALDARRILAIGDGMRTDIAGAAARGLDTLFVAAGIHEQDAQGERALGALFARESLRPTLVIDRIRP